MLRSFFVFSVLLAEFGSLFGAHLWQTTKKRRGYVSSSQGAGTQVLVQEGMPKCLVRRMPFFGSIGPKGPEPKEIPRRATEDPQITDKPERREDSQRREDHEMTSDG